jgi:hypothetical protein
MNHDAVVRGSAFVNDAVEYLNKQKPPIPLVLAEVGNALGNASNNSALENVLGDSLWLADFFLYSMSIVSDVSDPPFFQMNRADMIYQTFRTSPGSITNPASRFPSPSGIPHTTTHPRASTPPSTGRSSQLSSSDQPRTSA